MRKYIFWYTQCTCVYFDPVRTDDMLASALLPVKTVGIAMRKPYRRTWPRRKSNQYQSRIPSIPAKQAVKGTMLGLNKRGTLGRTTPHCRKYEYAYYRHVRRRDTYKAKQDDPGCEYQCSEGCANELGRDLGLWAEGMCDLWPKSEGSDVGMWHDGC